MKTLILLFFSPLILSFFVRVTPDSVPEPKTVVDLNEYVGTYAMSEYFEKTTITLKEGALYGEVDGNGVNKLLPQTEPDTFKSTSSYGTIYVFSRDEKTKKVNGVTLKLMGQEVRGNKAQVD